MSFQAYLDNIKAKTGKGPDDFHAAAKKKGLTGPDIKATQITDWLKQDYELGHGHAMALFAVFKQKGWAGTATADAKAKIAARIAAPKAKTPVKAKPAKKPAVKKT
ncbi:hypothetical protein sos41_29960 [Alphaproteobacteria bacterium SO-S41]|nr:hypothetical protein sos41_29960 [Alphaproteobacteria bacterium SO-S41]